MKLKFSEMYWEFRSDKNEREGWSGTYLGEAGNPSYRVESQVQAMRFGDEVLVSGTRGTHIIPADCPVKGFGEQKDGKTPRALMTDGLLYSYFLDPYQENAA
jgi:hypothetical protein